jgi:hypothetical protein
MGGGGVDRPPSLICPRASTWRAALVPVFCVENFALMCRGSEFVARRAKAPEKSIPGPLAQGEHWHLRESAVTADDLRRSLRPGGPRRDIRTQIDRSWLAVNEVVRLSVWPHDDGLGRTNQDGMAC